MTNNYSNLSNKELYIKYQEAKANFRNAIEGSQEEIEADRIFTELSQEVESRNDFDWLSFKNEELKNSECTATVNMTMKETIKKILVRAIKKEYIKTIEEVQYFINSDNNILVLIPLKHHKGKAKIMIFQNGESTTGRFGKDFRQVDIDINKDIQNIIYKVFINGVCMYKYEDFGEDKAIDRIKSQLKDKEYTLLQVI
jgi:hypothetical protein